MNSLSKSKWELDFNSTYLLPSNSNLIFNPGSPFTKCQDVTLPNLQEVNILPVVSFSLSTIALSFILGSELIKFVASQTSKKDSI